MESYKDYLKSDCWKNKKTETISLNGSVCSRCGVELSRKDLELHHKNYDQEFGEENQEDLMLVCTDCHEELHQDIEFFDNPNLKDKCPECRRTLINNKCKFCGIEIIPLQR
jgi:hypothetical protein